MTQYCSVNRLYSDLIMGPTSPVCFVSSAGGQLDKVRATPGMMTMSQSITQPVSLLRQEVPVGAGGAFKREMVFDGARDGMLFFTQHTYEQSLGKPSRSKPLIVKAQPLPVTVTSDGTEFTVVASKDGAITVRLDKAWN